MYLIFVHFCVFVCLSFLQCLKLYTHNPGHKARPQPATANRAALKRIKINLTATVALGNHWNYWNYWNHWDVLAMSFSFNCPTAAEWRQYRIWRAWLWSPTIEHWKALTRHVEVQILALGNHWNHWNHWNVSVISFSLNCLMNDVTTKIEGQFRRETSKGYTHG